MVNGYGWANELSALAASSTIPFNRNSARNQPAPAAIGDMAANVAHVFVAAHECVTARIGAEAITAFGLVLPVQPRLDLKWRLTV